MQPFSVLMSVYFKDSPEFLRIALDSIWTVQTVKPAEIVIVKDGKLTEELDDVVNTFESVAPIIIVQNENNEGLGISLQKGTLVCSNEIIARMDSDDVSVATRFEKQMEYLSSHLDVSLVGGQIDEFIETIDNIVGSRIVPKSDSAIKDYLKSRCPFNHTAVMFRKNAVLKVGNYLDWHWNEDYYLWVRMALDGCKFANLSDKLVNVRVGKEMYKRRGGWKYFKSEALLQKYMFSHGLIGIVRCITNVTIRFVIQVIMPNQLRGFVFQKLLRK